MRNEDGKRVYAVLGASGGIGSALARRLSSEGAQLALAARDRDRLKAVSEETGAYSVVFDANDWEQTRSFFTKVHDTFGRVDGVAHCVGSLLLKPAHRTTREAWDEVIQTNLSSAFGALQAAVGVMKGSGSIVFVSSAAARRGMANHEAIAAAKAGLIGLTLSAAATYASRGIRINCVAPGLTQTPLTEALTGNDLARKASIAMHPMGLLGDGDDVASAMAWFLDPAQKWVTGQVLGVDGGLATLMAKQVG